jgi:uncharacterized protein YukE
MTGRGFDVHPDSLTRAATELTNAAAAIGVGLDRLRTALGGLGSPWGNDEVGTPFGQEYSALQTQAFAAIESYQRQVGYAGQVLPRAAGGFEDLDQEGARRLAGLSAATDSPPPSWLLAVP